MTPLARGGVRALLLVLIALIVSAQPVTAHEGGGVLVVEGTEDAGDLAIRYVLRLTWENDDHPARDATLTAALTADDGTAHTPVPLTPVDEDGRYGAVVVFPNAGIWSVRFTSVSPTASIELAEEIAAPVEPAATTPPSIDPTPVAPDEQQATPAPSREEEDGGFRPGSVVFGGVIVALLGGAAMVIGTSRRGRPSP